MLTNFRISFTFNRLNEPLIPNAEDFVKSESLLESLHHFLSYYRGEFELLIADRRLHFDFDPDLSTIFEELPYVLEQLTTDTTEPVYLDFFEQGTDIVAPRAAWCGSHDSILHRRLYWPPISRPV